MSTTALIVAAGTGERLGGGLPKQFRKLGGKSLLRHCVEAFIGHPAIEQVRVVVAADQEPLARQCLDGLGPIAFSPGGAKRHESVRNGLAEVTTEMVLVHDCARPFCPRPVIDRLIAALGDGDAAVPVLAVADTLAGSGDALGATVDRDSLVRVQTPQAFRTAALRRAHDSWSGGPATDDSQIARSAGFKVATVAGDAKLHKITDAADWERAEDHLAARLVTRIGSGFDVHAFDGDGPIILGGITVPHDRGLAGHSDADVALHAITDALLGAAALGDIGEHFPPSDPRWKGASSDVFLVHAADLIRSAGGLIDHIDCTIIAEQPKIGPHRQAMRSRIAGILGLRETQVSVKATTTERLGFTGRSEGIAAQAVATIRTETYR